MAAEDYAKLSDSEKKKEDWMNSKWRPMMGWIYMLTCVTDFILFPILWSILQAVMKQPVTAWQPITLQGAGLFHLSMGAIIGVAAFGRTQEKLAGANNGGIQTPATGPTGGSPAFGAPSTGGFGSPSTGFGSTPLGGNSASSFGGGGFGSTSPSTGFNGNTGFGGATSGPVANPPSWGTTPISTPPAVITGFGGKPAPVQPEQPIL
jgi:hypothetical protein